jgi:hypothetical protein
MGIQVVQFDPATGQPSVVVGDAQCNADPCAKHGTCHCMCVCGFDRDDCADCAEEGDEIELATGESGWPAGWQVMGIVEE